MNKKILIPVGAGIVVFLITIILSFDTDETKVDLDPSLSLDFNYDEANSNLRKTLEESKISMSSTIKLNKIQDIKKFCTFFEDESIQNLVEFCTSTELLDSEGNFLGNIHMIGSPELPNLVLVLIQTDPFMNNLPEIKLIFREVIENLVCNCWEDAKPSNINTIEEWIDRQRDFHFSALRSTSKSNLSLEGKQLQIELTTNTEGYLWKLFVGTEPAR